MKINKNWHFDGIQSKKFRETFWAQQHHHHSKLLSVIEYLVKSLFTDESQLWISVTNRRMYLKKMNRRQNDTTVIQAYSETHFRLLHRTDPNLTVKKHLSICHRHAPPSGWFFLKMDSSSSGIMSPNTPQSFDTTAFTFITFLGPERVWDKFSDGCLVGWTCTASLNEMFSRWYTATPLTQPQGKTHGTSCNHNKIT